MSGHVYILCKDGQPIYVGQSRNVNRRIPLHRHMNFDHVFIREVDDKYRRAVEAELIRSLKPAMNTNHNPDAYVPMVQIPIRFPFSDLEAMRSISKETGRSVQSLLREAVTYYLARKGKA